MCSSPEMRPCSMASLNSPASLRTDSRLSQNSAAAATVSGSISQAVGELAPTALTWAPGASQACSRTGRLALVAIVTTSAPRTASWRRRGDDDVGANVAQRLGVRGRRGIDADLVPRAHVGEREEMGAGLHAGAEHPQDVGAGAGQRAGGDGGDRGGADLGDRRRVEDRRRHPGLAVVEHHRALVGVQAPRRVAGDQADRLEPERRAVERRWPTRPERRRPASAR